MKDAGKNKETSLRTLRWKLALFCMACVAMYASCAFVISGLLFVQWHAQLSSVMVVPDAFGIAALAAMSVVIVLMATRLYVRMQSQKRPAPEEPATQS